MTARLNPYRTCNAPEARMRRTCGRTGGPIATQLVDLLDGLRSVVRSAMAGNLAADRNPTADRIWWIQ